MILTAADNTTWEDGLGGHLRPVLADDERGNWELREDVEAQHGELTPAKEDDRG